MFMYTPHYTYILKYVYMLSTIFSINIIQICLLSEERRILRLLLLTSKKLVTHGTIGSVFSTVKSTFLVGTTVPSGTAQILRGSRPPCLWGNKHITTHTHQ